MQMLEEIAKADASTAWCLGQCSRLRHDGGLSRSRRRRNEIFNTPPGILAWGAIAHEVQVVPGGYRATARWDFASRLAPGELARRPCPGRRGRRHAAAQAQRRAGDPHHPVSDRRAPPCTTSGT